MREDGEARRCFGVHVQLTIECAMRIKKSIGGADAQNRADCQREGDEDDGAVIWTRPCVGHRVDAVDAAYGRATPLAGS